MYREVLISYFHIDIRDSGGKQWFSSQDNGIVVLLDLTEDEKQNFEQSSLNYEFIKLEPPVSSD